MCEKSATERTETSQQGALCWKDRQDGDWGGAMPVDQ